jgi:hypothetical protein
MRANRQKEEFSLDLKGVWERKREETGTTE